MPTGRYQIRVRMTEFDASRATEVREELRLTVRGAGSARLKNILRRVNDGQHVVIYQTNSRRDGEIVAQRMARAGAKCEVDG